MAESKKLAELRLPEQPYQGHAVMTDFGQSVFGQSVWGHRVLLANFGQSVFGQN